jgi:hypothetical protein
VLFWKRAARLGFRPPTAVAPLDLLVVALALALAVALEMDGIIVVVASESCCCVRMDVKRISIFLDFNIYHDIIKNLFRKV